MTKFPKDLEVKLPKRLPTIIIDRIVINHSIGQYAENGVHVNNVENFWSLLKRGVMGSFHHISEKYMQAYVNEFSWRVNNRGNEFIFNDLMDRMIF